MGVQAKQSTGSGREAKLIFTLSSAFMFHLYLPPAPAERVAMAAACCLSASSLLLLSALIFHRMFAARGLQVSMITKEHVAFCHCRVCIPPSTKTRRMLRITLWNFCSCCLYFFTGSARCIPIVTICFFKYLCQTLVE